MYYNTLKTVRQQVYNNFERSAAALFRSVRCALERAAGAQSSQMVAIVVLPLLVSFPLSISSDLF